MVDLKKDEQAALASVNQTESWVKAHPVLASLAAIIVVFVLGFIVGKLL